MNTQKVCFITGGAKRIGKEIAIAFAKKNYAVFFTYLSDEQKANETLREIRQYSPNSRMFKVDFKDFPSIQKTFDFFFAHYTRLDIVILNASSFHYTPLLEVTEEQWNDSMNVNLKAPFFIMQIAAKRMITQKFTSRMIALTDVATDLVWRHYAPYTTSKTGLKHLIKIFAKTLAPNVMVNSISPGTILLSEKDTPYKTDIEQKIPMQRIGTPNDIVQAILFLSEAEYVTGQTIAIDGGRLLV